MKTRHVCAALGIAAAVGAVVFTKSLVATSDAQAPAVARRMLSEVPVGDNALTARFALDFRPGGRVMQGPPLTATVATRPGVEGIAVTRALFAQRRLKAPPAGTSLKLVGKNGAYDLPITEFIDWERPAGFRSAYPNAFVSPETAATIGEDWDYFEPVPAEQLAAAFKSDAARDMDRSKPLLLCAAALTALTLLVNTLLLSVGARRREIAILRLAGMTRSGVAMLLVREACALAFAGFAVGAGVAVAAVFAFAAANSATFPEGAAVSWGSLAATAAATPLVAATASLFAMKSALSVKPLEAASARPPRRGRTGMIIAFAFGFGSFVAVEVWGSSLMKAFVPSPEWPDAIVSILPAGVSSFDIEKLRNLEGVARIAELQPLQVNFDPFEEMTGQGNGNIAAQKQRDGNIARQKQNNNNIVGQKQRDNNIVGQKQRDNNIVGPRPPRRGRNALLLASDWLPRFHFVAGDRESAESAMMGGDACVITSMMARSRKLALGDTVDLDCGHGLKMKLKIVGVVDLNWHMVTSRALVRGMNGAPVNTDGPVFVSFDTLAACDPRPQQTVGMTHLWLDYKPEFLEKHGAFKAGRIVEAEIVKALDGAYTENDNGEVRGNTVRLHSRDEIADGTLAHGNDLIGAMAKVPFIFVFVVSIGFVATLVAVADARKKELAVLRAVGATRLRLAAVLAADAAKTALLGVAFGLAGGTGAGWLFTFSTRAAMSNWGLPPTFAVPWCTIAAGAGIALAAALAVAAPASAVIIARTTRR